jgi:phosphatidylinositol alpha-1,6-mannosyltransferase
VLLLATEIWRTHGGVQRYMRILTRILADRGGPFYIGALLDGPEGVPSDSRAAAVVCGRGSKWRFCLDTFRLARQSRPDTAIIGHVNLLPVAWALRLSGLVQRYVVVLHGTEAWCQLPRFSQLAARKADAIIATTAYTAREFCFFNHVRSEAVAVIPLACTFPPSTRTLRQAGPLKLLTVTRLSTTDAYKGVDTLLKGVRRALDSGLTVSLDVVGSGDDLPRLVQLAESLGLGDRVIFHGSVSDDELPAFFSNAQVFALPSKKEGFGIVFLEAMSMGLPCIAANHGGTPEVIEHGESGFLIEYGDVEQLVFYLRALTLSAGLYEEMSLAARKRATETLGFGTMSRSWNDLLDHIEGVPASGVQPDSVIKISGTAPTTNICAASLER